jgi:hypothetical protein
MKRLISLTTFAIYLLMAAHPVLAASRPPAQGETLPPFELAMPQDAGARTYLGLSNSGQFTIPQIKARVVIIEIFNMY